MEVFWTAFFTALVPITVTFITAWFAHRNKASQSDLERCRDEVKSLKDRIVVIETAERECLKNVAELKRENDAMKAKLVDRDGGPNFW